MFENIELFLRPVFVLAAALYLGLAIYVARSSAVNTNSVIAFFLFLIGVLVAGTAFSFGTQDPNIYGIGRVLSFFASGFGNTRSARRGPSLLRCSRLFRLQRPSWH
jgi:hypothetical protein